VQDCTRYLLPVQDMGGSSNAESVRIECLPVCVKKGVVTGTQLCPVWIQIPVPVPVVRHRQLVVWNLVPPWYQQTVTSEFTAKEMQRKHRQERTVKQ